MVTKWRIFGWSVNICSLKARYIILLKQQCLLYGIWHLRCKIFNIVEGFASFSFDFCFYKDALTKKLGRLFDFLVKIMF